MGDEATALKFDIDANVSAGLVSITRWGLWTAADAAFYHGRVEAVLAMMAAKSIAFDLLTDVTRAETLPQNVAARMRDVAATIEASAARRIAFVSPGGINRLQINRLFTSHDRLRVFTDRPSALAWLHEERQAV